MRNYLVCLMALALMTLVCATADAGLRATAPGPAAAITGLPVPVDQGGTGGSTPTAAINTLTGNDQIFYAAHFADEDDVDDCDKIQAAHDAALSAGGGFVILDSSDYTCPETALTWDVTYVGLSGNGAFFDLTGREAGNFWTIGQDNESGNARKARSTTYPIENISLNAPLDGTQVNVFVFDTQASLSGSNAVMRGILIRGGYDQVRYQDSAYLVHWSNSRFQGFYNSGWNIPAGYGDYGEGLNLYGGVFSDGLDTGVAIRSSGTSGTNVTIFGTSFDFNEKDFLVEGGFVYCVACHWERQGSDLVDSVFEVADQTGALLVLQGGDFHLNGTGPFSGTSCLFEANGAGTIKFVDVQLHNTQLSSNQLGCGTGDIIMRGTQGFETSIGNVTIQGVTQKNQNFMYDGEFEEASIRDMIWISSDASVIVSRTDGDSADISLDALCADTGSQGLRFTKNFGSGAASSYRIAVPIQKKAQYIGILRYKTLDTPNGTGYLSRGWASIQGTNGNGIPIIGKSTNIGTTTLNLSGSDLDWTNFAFGQGESQRAPAWATHWTLEYNAASVDAHSLCIDNVNINEM